MAREDLRKRLDDRVNELLGTDSIRLDRTFTISLLVFVGLMLAVTPQYRDDSQLFPLVIGVPTFALLTFLLALQMSTKLRERVDRLSTSNLFTMENQLRDIGGREPAEAPNEGDDLERRKRAAIVSLWTLVLFALIIIVGILPGILAFMLAFYRLRARQDWLRTIAYSGIVWLFIVLIFDVVLNTPLYNGLFGLSVPLP